ncbi:MAG: glutathione transferase GstA [Gammaproteobacteria bacterium]|nr:glutathione transferase GstA [Gammaproteobacteria bacterium]
MKLYYSKGACSLTIRILLHEMGIPSDYEAVDLQHKKTADGEDFLSINPKGAVPTLRLENGKILTENGAIMQYLADHYQAENLLPRVGDWQRYRVLEWMNFITTELHKGFGPLFNPQISQALRDEVFIPILMRKFHYVDQCLTEHTYLLGNHFMLADAYLFVMLRWAIGQKFDMTPCTRLMAYYTHLKSRKSIADALAKEGIA